MLSSTATPPGACGAGGRAGGTGGLQQHRMDSELALFKSILCVFAHNGACM